MAASVCLPAAAGHEVEHLEGHAALLDPLHAPLRREKPARPREEVAQLFGRGQVGPVGEQDVRGLYLVAHDLPLECRLAVRRIDQAHHRSHVDARSDAVSVERVEDARDRSQPGGFDEQPVRAAPEKRDEGDLEDDPCAAADAPAGHLLDLHAARGGPLARSRRAHEGGVEAHEPVLVDEDGPPLVVRPEVEQVVDARRLAYPERPADHVHGNRRLPRPRRRHVQRGSGCSAGPGTS
mmetsp:Transcript_10243/g.25987  ORF Transcript_10243/g.25987 Transcript_10243/m.25987 type:complete len:237 (+) Transcript_10243:512-1222(+)